MKYIIGIDEVGRGCLAGPVVVTAFAVPLNSKFQITNIKQNPNSKISNLKLRDSKKLSARQREEWFEYIKSREDIIFVTKKVSPKVIDKINISAAANLAAHRALYKLITNNLSLLTRFQIFLDGGLYIKNKNYQKDFFPKAETVIKGDEKVEAVALASIVAKVSRDRYMTRLHRKHPEYGFHIHKGYGTKAHRKAISKHGIGPIHRLTFLR